VCSSDLYTAPCDGLVLIDTIGSTFADSDEPPANDPVLTVFDACGGTELACDDDGGPLFQAALELSITEGVTYTIRVAGFEDGVGDIVLNITPIDDCVIDGVCFAEGAVNPGNDCEECNPALSSSDWSPRLPGTSCGNPSVDECDNPDACDGAGLCEINNKPNGTQCPTDGNDCTAPRTTSEIFAITGRANPITAFIQSGTGMIT